jgi:hypothetical protein
MENDKHQKRFPGMGQDYKKLFVRLSKTLQECKWLSGNKNETGLDSRQHRKSDFFKKGKTGLRQLRIGKAG